MRSGKILLSLAILLSMFALLFLVIPAEAQAATEGMYTYTVDGGKATITDVDADICGVVTIPSKLGGYPVTGIGQEAFYECYMLTSVTVPGSVTTIEEAAFKNCDNLITITIPSSVTFIGKEAFYGTRWFEERPDGVIYIGKILYAVKGKSPAKVSVKSGTTTIAPSAFESAYSLISVTIPDSVKTIGKDAFEGCSNLVEITIPDSGTIVEGLNLDRTKWYENLPDGVIYIGKVLYAVKGESPAKITVKSGTARIASYAFFGKENLTEIIIPSSVKSIGQRAFCESGVTAVTLGSGVTEVEDYAFCGCNSLKTVTIGKNVTSISSKAFEDCGYLTAIQVDSNNATYSSDNKGVLFNKNKTVLIRAPEALKGDYTIPGSVKKIGENAFYYCKNLLSVSLGSGITEIGQRAFFRNTQLTSMKIPDSVKTIGKGAFEDCSDLRSVTIGSGVTEIGEEAFYLCYGLTSVTIPGSVKTIGKGAFKDCNDLRSVTIGSGVTEIGENAFCACYRLTSVTIPGSVKTIGKSAFRNCTSLNSVTIGKGVITIKEGAFYSADLESVVIPNSVKTIEQEAFYFSDLKSVVIPEGVTTIGDRAFKQCFDLVSITVPNSVTFIGKEAFEETKWLADKPDGVVYAGKVLYKAKGVTPADVVVKDGTVSISPAAFSQAENLETVTIPGSVKDIGAEAFSECMSLYKVTLSNGVTTIGESAFSCCQYLKSINLPDSITSIGNAAFFFCRNLTTVVLPDSISVINPDTFAECNLTALTIPDSVKEINLAFNECNNLTAFRVDSNNPWFSSDSSGVLFNKNKTNLIMAPKGLAGTYTIPSSVQVISKGAFSNCKKLTAMNIPNSVTIIGPSAFLKCSGLTAITIPNQVQKLSYGIFEGCSNLKSINIPVSLVYVDESVLGPWWSTIRFNTVFYQGSQEKWEKLSYKDIFESAEKIFKGFYQMYGETYYGENGQKITGWKTINGKKHYFKEWATGAMAKGWTEINEKKYYFKKADGAMVSGVVTIGGAPHLFSSTGVWQKQITAPKITKQPVSVIVANGKTAAVSLTASGEGLSYKWYFKDRNASKFSLTNSFTGNTYSVAMNTTRAGRQLYCVVTDKYGQTVKTNTVTLRMTGAAYITKQPASVKVASGKTAKVTFTATGDGLKYTWYFKNSGAASFSKTTAFTGNTYSVTMDKTRSGRQLYCVVTDKYGVSVKTNTVTISMAAAPKITKQPVSARVANGALAKVNFTATGEGLIYKWYYKDATASKFALTTTFTGNNYSATMNATRAGRQLYCVVTDKYGQSVKTNIVTISMATAPKITKQPVSARVANGALAKVNFTATGEGLTYKWYFKDKTASKFSLTTTFTGNNYSATMNATRSGRQLYCVVTDKYGQSVKTNTVTISMK